MEKTNEKREDVVNKEAFNVVRNDFCNSLQHTEKDIFTALGVPNRQPSEEEFVFLHKLLDLGTMTEAIEKLIQKAPNFNEFMVTLYMYFKMCENRKRLMQEIDSAFDSIFSDIKKKE